MRMYKNKYLHLNFFIWYIYFADSSPTKHTQGDHLLSVYRYIHTYTDIHGRLTNIPKERKNYRFSILLNFPDRITTNSVLCVCVRTTYMYVYFTCGVQQKRLIEEEKKKTQEHRTTTNTNVGKLPVCASLNRERNFFKE